MLLCNLTLSLVNGICIHATANTRERVDVTVLSDHRTRIQHGTTADLNTISDHCTDLLASGLDLLILCVDLDKLLVRLYI